jgi:DNA-binding phage protein
MKPFKLEVIPAGLSKEEFLKKVTEEANGYANLHSVDFLQGELIAQVPELVAKHLGKPSIKTITQVIEVLAPYSRKYADKGKADDAEKKERKPATDEQKSKAIADLKAGKSVKEVAKEAGLSDSWAYLLKKSLSGGAKPKTKAKTKAKS